MTSLDAGSVEMIFALCSAVRRNPSWPSIWPLKERGGSRLHLSVLAPLTSVLNDNAELICSHSRTSNSYSLLAGPLPRLRSFFAPADGSTLNQSLRVLGSSAASCVFTQLAIAT